jgi:hypothetical protein
MSLPGLHVTPIVNIARRRRCRPPGRVSVWSWILYLTDANGYFGLAVPLALSRDLRYAFGAPH